jgi:hypothetical protein
LNLPSNKRNKSPPKTKILIKTIQNSVFPQKPQIIYASTIFSYTIDKTAPSLGETSVSKGLSRAFVVAALLIVIVAAVLLGMVIGYDLKGGSKPVSNIIKPADITLVVEGHLGGSLGPDNQTHDTFIPCNFTIYAGQPVSLTIINYDEGPHSFTSPTLNVDFQIPGHEAANVPSVSHFQFTQTTAGTYRWWCATPCDAGQGGWAMTTGSDGQPGQIGYMGGFVTVLQG